MVAAGTFRRSDLTLQGVDEEEPQLTMSGSPSAG
eukprot:CAMPEP_0170442596 /NCGR_PEP_ID=MMETSP0117_2-20130122/47511_1 /TAXON_ID=400756 /ORGANISM="Durinskia baltica, Strain CSIRO CS-38" /LENGTH=33 /DNA_ID= /DNA_START= /DNA_END= /DNA_ORIENTATION=